MPVVPSGEQCEISHGDQRATIVEVGGGVRTYRVGDRDVLHPYDKDAMCDGAHGAPLIPWPNRLGDGRYAFDGVDYQVALTEPEKHNAIHGFLRWRPWRAVDRRADRVTMTTRLLALQGYPFALDVEVAYRLDDAGLTVTTTAVNTGPGACPYATGHHPYLSPGTGLIDDCTLRFGAGSRVDTDPDRQLPTGIVDVRGTPFDFADGRRLGDLEIDFAFGDLRRDADGRVVLALTGPDGRTAELWIDKAYRYLEIFTADGLAPSRRRRGLGVEPMTAPPNAFASGIDVVRLEPGDSHTAAWGCRLA